MTRVAVNPVIKIVGVGSFGVGVTKLFEADVQFGLELVHVYTSSKIRARSDSALATSVVLQGIEKSGGEKLSKSNRENLSIALHGADLVIVVAAIWEDDAGAVSRSIAELARPKGMSIVAALSVSKEAFSVFKSHVGDSEIRIVQRVVDSIFITEVERTKGIYTDICRFVRSITGPIYHPGIVSPDFSDVIGFLRKMGRGVVGVGVAVGFDRGTEAARIAVDDLLLTSNESQSFSPGIVAIAGDEKVCLRDFVQVGELMETYSRGEESAILGVSYDPAMGDQLSVVVLARE